MQFGTLTYLLFVPVVFSMHWFARRRSLQNLVLLLASYTFYAWWDYRFCALMAVSSLVDYVVALRVDRATSAAARTRLLIVSCSANLGLLGTFKYFGFFQHNLIASLALIGIEVDWTTLNIVLPVGISFYTFQTMSYTIDVYRGELQPTRNLIDYLVYVSFFPQLVAGPIERGGSLLPQFLGHRRFDFAQASDGCRQVLWGLLKKMVIADRLSLVVDRIYGDPTAFTGIDLATATIFFAFQIYCDFSAYSDIAIGTARLFGVSLRQNFAFPYFSQTLVEFWRRWHMSLSTWFRDYVFIPLGGSRRRQAVVARNIMLTFVISGLWHGASWNFVMWGFIHGLFVLPRSLGGGPALAARDVPGGENPLPTLGGVIHMLGVFAIVCFGWVFFRASTFGDAISILASIGRLPFEGGAMKGPVIYYLIGLVMIAALLVVEWVSRRHTHPLEVVASWPWPARWSAYTSLMWGGLYLIAPSSGPFIYFQF